MLGGIKGGGGKFGDCAANTLAVTWRCSTTPRLGFETILYVHNTYDPGTTPEVLIRTHLFASKAAPIRWKGGRGGGGASGGAGGGAGGEGGGGDEGGS